MFSNLWNIIKEIVRKMLKPKTIEQVLQVSPIVSDRMQKNIELWARMYKDEAPWLHNPDFEDNSYNDNQYRVKDESLVISMGLPATIASEKARTACIELKVTISTPEKKTMEENPDYIAPTWDSINKQIKEGFDSSVPKFVEKVVKADKGERADYLNKVFNEKVTSVIKDKLEVGIAYGGFVIKPYLVPSADGGYEFNFEYVWADAFYPLAFDGNSKLTEACFVQVKTDKNSVYRRLEYHKLDNNSVKIINKAFKAQINHANMQMNEMELGVEIPLTDVPEWKDIPKEADIAGVDRLLFGYFKMPLANNIEPNSPLGISGYSRATYLIKEADKQFSRLLWEFEGGELAIDIDRDALMEVSTDGVRYQSKLNRLQNRLYRKVDLGESNTYNLFNPTLRDVSYINGLNNILMRIEDACAISRGTLADMNVADARTAEELRILKQRTYSANCDVQRELERTLKDVIYVMNVYSTLYNLASGGEYEAAFEWDDSILADPAQELSNRITLQHEGLASKLENRMWYFGETEEQAREALAKIEDENRLSMENELKFNMTYNPNNNEE